MKNQIKAADAVLEPELRELCGELSPEQRMRTAEKFLRWADQLTESVGMSKPDLVKPLPPPAVPRGFFLVNCAEWQQEEMRQLAHAVGANLRDLMGWAMVRVRCELRRRVELAALLGVPARKLWVSWLDAADGRS